MARVEVSFYISPIPEVSKDRGSDLLYGRTECSGNTTFFRGSELISHKGIKKPTRLSFSLPRNMTTVEEGASESGFHLNLYGVNGGTNCAGIARDEKLIRLSRPTLPDKDSTGKP